MSTLPLLRRLIRWRKRFERDDFSDWGKSTIWDNILLNTSKTLVMPERLFRGWTRVESWIVKKNLKIDKKCIFVIGRWNTEPQCRSADQAEDLELEHGSGRLSIWRIKSKTGLLWLTISQWLPGNKCNIGRIGTDSIQYGDRAGRARCPFYLDTIKFVHYHPDSGYPKNDGNTRLNATAGNRPRV